MIDTQELTRSAQRAAHTHVLIRLVLCWLAGTGCIKTNPAYCESNRDCAADEFCDAVDMTCRVRSGLPTADGGAGDGDGGIDSACPLDTHQCTPAPAELWLGPVLRTDADSANDLIDCSGSHPRRVADLGADVIANGACACACGEASGVSCSDATVEGRSSTNTSFSQCMLECFDGCPTADVPPLSCTVASSAMRSSNTLRFEPGHVVDGNCGDPMVQSSIEPAEFSTYTRLCEATELAGDCDDGQVCAPVADAGGATCIFREGVHECPDTGPYQRQTIRYRSIADSRRCADDCSCTLPSDSCGGQLLARKDYCDTLVSSTAACISASPGGYTHLAYEPDLVGHMCSASGGELEGTAAADEPVTLCCTGPL